MRTLIINFSIISLCTLFGCSDKSSDYLVGDLQLRIEVNGITSLEDPSLNKTAQGVGSLFAGNKRTSSSNTGQTSGFTADFVATQDLIDSPLEDMLQASDPSKSERSNSTVSRATTAMPSGYTYRILVYNKTTGELWRTIQATSGTPVSLEVDRGNTYTWYAYSYNNMDDIATPDNFTNPVIETSINKDFLYARGEITIPQNTQTDFGIGIVFDHKVTQVHIKADATVLARFARIDNLNISFDNNNYLKKGTFNIRDNQMNNIEVVPTETIFNEPSATNIWEKSYFTVDPSVLSTYKIVINDLPVVFDEVDPSVATRNLATYFGAANKPAFTSSFASPAIGQRLSTIANLSYQVAPLRILHISNNTSYGYALQRGPAWDFLNAKINFGDLPESVVKLGSWAPGQGGWIGGNQTDNMTENWIQFAASTSGDNQIVSRLVATNTANRPDIVILGYNVTSIRPAVATALNNYINDKGVVVLMLQDANNANTITFFNNLFGISTIGMNASGSGGAMYPIEGNDPNDVILNGPFGDVRGRHWGEDAGTTLGLTNLPLSQVTTYSYGNAINRAVGTARVTMFKHNTKSFFYIGDGGFVSYNGGTSATICPFNYDPITKRPLPQPFGNNGNGYTARSLDAYNSVVMANIMAWAVKKAELEGIRQWKYAAPPTP